MHRPDPQVGPHLWTGAAGSVHCWDRTVSDQTWTGPCPPFPMSKYDASVGVDLFICFSDAEVTNVLETIIGRFGIDLSNFAVVFVAQDTRPSSQTLSVAVREGVEALGASARDFHLLTTPQLHHIVNVKNSTFGLTLTDLPDATDSLPLSPVNIGYCAPDL